MRRSYIIPSGLAAPATHEDKGPKLAEVRAAVDAIAEHPSRLGLDGLDRQDGEGIPVTLDTDIVPTACLYGLLLDSPPPWLGDLAAEGPLLTALLGQQQELQAVRLAAEQADADLSDTDRFVGLKEQAMQEELSSAIAGLLSGEIGGLSPEQREVLRLDAADYLRLEEQDQAGRVEQRRQGRAAAAEHKGAVGEAEKKERLAEVMLALRHDRPVDDGTLDEALTTYANL